jgi:hypothetical protein
MSQGDIVTVDIIDQLLPATPIVIYTVPISGGGNVAKKTVFIEIDLCNTDNISDDNLQLYFVPAAGSPGPTNQRLNLISGINSLQRGESRQYVWNRALSAGMTIWAAASSANKVSLGGMVVEEEV